MPWSLTVALVLGAAAALFVARIIRTGGCTDDNGWLLPMGTLLALMIVVAVTTSIVWAIEAGDPISVLRSGGRYGIFIVTGTLISSILTPARRSTEPPK
ncbi:MAG: hypothetical protein Q7R62_01280 [bacterium]|nr:hypothetical protein [bacterium]